MINLDTQLRCHICSSWNPITNYHAHMSAFHSHISSKEAEDALLLKCVNTSWYIHPWEGGFSCTSRGCPCLFISQVPPDSRNKISAATLTELFEHFNLIEKPRLPPPGFWNSVHIEI